MFKKLALIATGAGLALAAVMMTAGADPQEVPAPEVVAPVEVVTEAPIEVPEAVEPVESVPAVEAPAEVQKEDSAEVAPAPVVPTCEEQGLITAEDMTCVPADYYEAPAPEYPTYTLPPCATEDSDNCYWNAARMGNGTGTSFINLDGVTYYAG